MNKCLGAAVMGFLMGLYLGYMKDEEIVSLYWNRQEKAIYEDL